MNPLLDLKNLTDKLKDFAGLLVFILEKLEAHLKEINHSVSMGKVEQLKKNISKFQALYDFSRNKLQCDLKELLRMTHACNNVFFTIWVLHEHRNYLQKCITDKGSTPAWVNKKPWKSYINPKDLRNTSIPLKDRKYYATLKLSEDKLFMSLVALKAKAHDFLDSAEPLIQKISLMKTPENCQQIECMQHASFEMNNLHAHTQVFCQTFSKKAYAEFFKYFDKTIQDFTDKSEALDKLYQSFGRRIMPRIKTSP